MGKKNNLPVVDETHVPAGMEVVQSVKNKTKQLIPVDRAYIYQSNKITFARYRSSLLLERLLTLIQSELQEAVLMTMKGDSNYTQLPLFSDNLVRVEIPLRQITKANSLDDVVNTCKSLMSMQIHFPSRSLDGKTEYLSIRHVVTGVDIPVTQGSVIKKGKHAGIQRKERENVIITMTKEEADRFIMVDYDPVTKRPKNFSRFLAHTAVNASTKYTAKLYKIISSWASKGGFVTSTDNLKLDLDIKGIDEKGNPYDLYPYYSDLVKRVLEPVRLELQRNTDCWFEYKPARKDGKKVIAIRFTIITPSLEKQITDKHDYIKYLLREHMKFTEADFKSIQSLFSPLIDPEDVTIKLFELRDRYAKEKADISNPIAWFVRCLNNFAKAKLKDVNK